MSKSSIKFNLDGSLMMPFPWQRFLRLERTGGATCDDPPKFVAADVWGILYLAPKEADTPPGYSDVGIETSTQKAMIFLGEFPTVDMVSYQISPALLESAAANNTGFEDCIADGKGDCVKAFGIVAPFGYFNFVKEASKSDAYVYALLPKSDVEAISTASSVSVGAGGDPGTGGMLDGLFRFGQKYNGTEARSVQVGFGDGQGSATENGVNNEVRFGWVIGPVTTATQGTQLVLLSVPAWSDELKLTVSVGWLDRGGNHHPSRPPFKMTVKLPPDYEAFDSFMAGPRARPAPRILEEFMDIGELRACRPASILIPGSRLWRSANVTLGAQQANKITVLPSMQGIIAEFHSVQIPNDAASAGGSQLRVWTSEGEASTSKRIKIRATAEEIATGICNAPAAETPPAEVATNASQG
jgi:hypothetical protein